jgi:hypothetical protein
MASGAPDWEGQSIEVGQGFLGILLGSRALRRRILRTILRDVASWRWLYLAAKPSHMAGWCGRARMPSAPSYDLQSSDEGTELSTRRCLVPSCDNWWWRLSRGVWSPWAWIFYGVLTVWVPVLPNLTWSKLFLPGHTYPMSESPWHLCVYPWLRHYVRRRWDRFQHLSTCCQVRVGSRSHVMSCQALNATAPWGPGAGNAYPLQNAPGLVDWMPRPCLGWGGRRDR